MHENGRGVLQGYKLAVKWYKAAAEQGYAAAQDFLGGMYFLGREVDKNIIYAYMWLNIAASNGAKLSEIFRNIALQQMTSFQIEEAQKLARECVRKQYKGC